MGLTALRSINTFDTNTIYIDVFLYILKPYWALSYSKETLECMFSEVGSEDESNWGSLQ